MSKWNSTIYFTVTIRKIELKSIDEIINKINDYVNSSCNNEYDCEFNVDRCSINAYEEVHE